jgi:GDP-L-fucose synthase
MMNLCEQRILVTGGAGFLGRRVCHFLREHGVPTDQIVVPRQRDYNLTERANVERLFDDTRPTLIIHLAGRVGGIGANRAHPGRFFYDSMSMGLHLIESARVHGLKKFVQVGTVCSYPKFAPVPFKESDLWNGYPEETNAPYGIAKKALLVMLDAYRHEHGLASAAVLPVNLYGPGDNFDPASSHVIPALIRKVEEARLSNSPSISAWGTGSASREFLFVDDAARGIIAATERMDDPDPINLGTGNEITIRELTNLICRLCDYRGEVVWDPSKPDGQPRRCLDTSKAEQLLGWNAIIPFEEGLRQTIKWWRQF